MTLCGSCLIKSHWIYDMIIWIASCLHCYGLESHWQISSIVFEHSTIHSSLNELMILREGIHRLDIIGTLPSPAFPVITIAMIKTRFQGWCTWGMVDLLILVNVHTSADVPHAILLQLWPHVFVQLLCDSAYKISVSSGGYSRASLDLCNFCQSVNHFCFLAFYLLQRHQNAINSNVAEHCHKIIYSPSLLNPSAVMRAMEAF